MAHSSNRDRIARAAEEARLTALEKAAKFERPREAHQETDRGASAVPLRCA
jgi:hypothetical protein